MAKVKMALIGCGGMGTRHLYGVRGWCNRLSTISNSWPRYRAALTDQEVSTLGCYSACRRVVECVTPISLNFPVDTASSVGYA